MEEEYTTWFTPERARGLLVAAIVAVWLGLFCLLLNGLDLLPMPWDRPAANVVWADQVQPLQPTAPLAVPEGATLRPREPYIDVRSQGGDVSITYNVEISDDDTTVCIALICP